MAQAMLTHYNGYNDRIVLLRREGDQLLQRIQMLEIGMNRRKQQNQKPLNNEVIALHAMVKKLLQMLAEINTCRYFIITMQKYHFNGYYYKQMCQRYFQDLMRNFTLELKRRRQRRNLNYDIDFMVNFK